MVFDYNYIKTKEKKTHKQTIMQAQPRIYVSKIKIRGKPKSVNTLINK